MNVAVVHDSLDEFGGAERVLTQILSLYPRAHVYTSFAGAAFRQSYLPDVPVSRFHISFLKRFPVSRHTSFIQAIAPLVWRSFDLSGYDLVISHGFHLMSNLVQIPEQIPHIAYIESVPKNILGITPPTPLQIIVPYAFYIRPLYRKALQSASLVLANSRHMQSVLKTQLGISSRILYPPVFVPRPTAVHKKARTYYLTVSRLAPDKHLEYAIRAANLLHVPYKIAGTSVTPPYERYLRSIAGPTVEFLGFQPDDALPALYAGAIAFIFPSRNEDFGITPLEAAIHGVPVVAYYGGGTKETVLHGKTGVFFRTHSAESLAAAMKRVVYLRFDRKTMRRHAESFNAARFQRQLAAYVDSVMSQAL